MFRKLLTVDEAKKTIEKYFKPIFIGDEYAPTIEAYNRVLNENVTSSFDIPSFNRSTVDGYAVRAEDTFGAEENAPAKLKVVGSVVIGEMPKAVVKKGEAAEIVTGAPIPEGADAVVMVEDTEKENEYLKVFTSATKNANVQKKGSDIKNGETVLKTGQILGASEIGVIAALGLTKIKVLKAPIVAIISTGGEVTDLGKELPAGKIYDINGYSISAAVLECGAKPVQLGAFPDDKAALTKALESALASADVVITSGGVSVGPKDYTPQVINSLGKPGVVVCGVALKPGKPTTVAFVNGKPVFSLPGHPASALLVFHLFAKPLIQRLAGRYSTQDRVVKAVAGSRMFSAKGRRTYVMVKLSRDKNNRLVAEQVESGASGAITTLSKADGFVEVAENNQFIDTQEEVTVILLRDVQI